MSVLVLITLHGLQCSRTTFNLIPVAALYFIRSKQENFHIDIVW